MKNQITKNFNLGEFTKSSKYPYIKNEPNEAERANLVALIVNVLQPLRDILDEPMTVNSGFRCHELNKLVGGVPTSQHRKGEASDFVVKGLSSKQVAEIILANEIPFDQLIVYPNFTHISYRRNGGNRRQVIYK